MSYSNTAQNLSAYRQPGHSSMAYHTTKVNSTREGIVVQVGPAENYCCKLMVYVQQTNETLFVEATATNHSSINGCGSFYPYFPGDTVLIGYKYGFDSRPFVINRLVNSKGLTEEFLSEEDYPLPQAYNNTPNGARLHPSPSSVTLESARWLGFTTTHIHPVFLP